jgi:hypothetical protein
LNQDVYRMLTLVRESDNYMECSKHFHVFHVGCSISHFCNSICIETWDVSGKVRALLNLSISFPCCWSEWWVLLVMHISDSSVCNCVRHHCILCKQSLLFYKLHYEVICLLVSYCISNLNVES